MKRAAGRQIVFHRAFDVVTNPLAPLDQLIDLGVTRVTTSGQDASAHNGAANIASYIKHVAERKGVLPDGGINRFIVQTTNYEKRTPSVRCPKSRGPRKLFWHSGAQFIHD